MARIKNPLSSSLKKLVKLSQKEKTAYQTHFELAASNLEQNTREEYIQHFFQRKFGKMSV